MKAGDIVKFIKKNDPREVIIGKITEVTDKRVFFIDLLYQDIGYCSFTNYTLSFWDIKIVS